ncbi:MAG: adenosylcobinamide-GDP ribazoletransferase, partial [Gemmatimonadetes bacterium]|nr:adenosylcobinamide-GDP ribazoletransferase [Gemmatimonadota bacterium]NIT88672.1 adenosylcobinamide-GDP ribazoletransferase [Gemmatimonadota bacterium]NIU32487.1 adenosylcobinamide-GDP ribazoletransferase [Gemmatimonadota bacterium]NIU36969.1 adenosylcobinamide-GDP ribazoletransferase [Gemmatimonadota bacterium]NIV62851.1 adenosylcobinamide-GDP ribazoletransferase [Gemmatimonadota bacterium]
RFLTALPLPGPEEEYGEEPGRAVAFYPVVGLAVGGAVAAVLAAPLPALPRAALALLVWVGVTGGLHEDGWMDVLDAAFAPVERARRLEILEDPRAGAHGVTGGVVLLLLRFGLLTAVSPVAPVVAAVLARWAMSLSLAFAPPARDTGLGASFALRPRWGTATVVAVLALGALGAWAGPMPVVAAVGVATLLALPWAFFLV